MELWCVAVFPSLYRRTRTAGTGAEQGSLSAQHVDESTHLLRKQVRASGLLPLWGMRTRPHSLRKRHTKFGPSESGSSTRCAPGGAPTRSGCTGARQRPGSRRATSRATFHGGGTRTRSLRSRTHSERRSNACWRRADSYKRPEDRALLARRRRMAGVALPTPEGMPEDLLCGATISDSMAAPDFAVAYQRGVAV